MDDSDGLSMHEDDRLVMAEVYSPADPVNLKTAFGMLVDAMTELSGSRIIDWGTFAVASQRILSASTGQELIYLQSGVRVMEVNLDEPEP